MANGRPSIMSAMLPAVLVGGTGLLALVFAPERPELPVRPGPAPSVGCGDAGTHDM